MSGFKRERHNPLNLIKSFWPKANTSHVTYDPNLKKGDFYIIRQCGGDGTLFFIQEMMQEGLMNIVNCQSYCKSKEPDWDKVKGVKYTLGSINHATVYGMIKLRCSSEYKYPGQRDRIRIPVKCEWIYSNQTPTTTQSATSTNPATLVIELE